MTGRDATHPSGPLRDIDGNLKLAGWRQCSMIAPTLHALGNCCVRQDVHAGPHKNSNGDEFTRVVNDSYEIHDAIVKMCPCEVHKRYRAKRPPQVTCEGCWRLWILTHPSWDLESRWRR